ncbi:unnamed protein product [Oppiella nova]|uniref:NR LBD domain-containing protein n=1 Tax=Oppiella nova TaxID=334625 RepID=A0A7R9QKT0_9ACAR|nr:unnamed protein product [Oppiella nova]CAG2167279.1 unnamed protein product [Oppiella nova]
MKDIEIYAKHNENTDQQSVVPMVRPMLFPEWDDTRLLELINGAKVYLYANSLTPVVRMTDLLQWYAIIDWFYSKDILKLIAMSKNLSAFDSMCDNDKIALVKYGWFEILCLRSLTYYCRSGTHDIWNIYIELTAIVLFNPNQKYLINSEVVK